MVVLPRQECISLWNGTVLTHATVWRVRLRAECSASGGHSQRGSPQAGATSLWRDDGPQFHAWGCSSIPCTEQCNGTDAGLNPVSSTRRVDAS